MTPRGRMGECGAESEACLSRGTHVAPALFVPFSLPGAALLAAAGERVSLLTEEACGSARFHSPPGFILPEASREAAVRSHLRGCGDFGEPLPQHRLLLSPEAECPVRKGRARVHARLSADSSAKRTSPGDPLPCGESL